MLVVGDAVMINSTRHRIGWAIAVLALLGSLSLTSVAGAAPASPELTKKVIAAAKKATRNDIVRFQGGYYDPTTYEAYVDEGAQVFQLRGNRLGPALGGSSGDFTTQVNCGGGYFHCEQVWPCDTAQTYLNYFPDVDDFRDPWGRLLVQLEQANVRNEPYRRYGPRGVRVYQFGRHGFMSNNCLFPPVG